MAASFGWPSLHNSAGRKELGWMKMEGRLGDLLLELMENRNEEDLLRLLKSPLFSPPFSGPMEVGDPWRVAVAVRDFYQAGAREVAGLLCGKVKNASLALAVERNDLDFFRFALAHVRDIEEAVREEISEGGLALWVVLQKRDEGFLEALLKAGLDPNGWLDGKSYGTPLIHYVVDDPQKLRLLVEYGADPNAKDYLGATSLRRALEWAPEESIRLLLEYGASSEMVDGGEGNLFHGLYARSVNHKDALRPETVLELTRLFLEMGVDPNVKDRWGRTALHVAIAGGHEEAAFLLLEAGADPRARDEKGNTPLHLAAYRGFPRLVEALLKRGADPNAGDGWDETPVHYAVGKPEVLKLLLKAGGDPNAQNYQGDTPAHLAAMNEDEASLGVLVKYGARLKIKKRYRYTPPVDGGDGT